ncbi:hypothetical protein [Lampropedia aestuarii]|uniref:hypothetical protein n=1 Tax=Lampropedia aestuarii TaxID=2562762 RepID=UPI002468FD97|nr:hypothetical protein [Lampropedia aestuarii]MDH5855708.1 hypothetical protein [Lampropedia aestuarii]
MKVHAQQFSRVTPLALALTSSILLAGCLGGSSEDPFKPNPDNPGTPADTAASCFDNALNYTAGRAIELGYTNYAITPEELRPSAAMIRVLGNAASFEGQTNLLQIEDIRGSILANAVNSWQTDLDTYIQRPIPSTGIVTTVGTVSKTTRNNNTSPAEVTITTIYNPAITDQRRTLRVNQSLTQNLSGTEKRTTPATSNQEAVETSEPFSYARTITFLGKENQSIGTLNVEACRFKTTSAGQPDITEWVYRGQTIRKESNGSLVEQVTGFTPSS